ncbi:uncharacterized protein LOC111912052 [Lactuca sativa]|uniref:DUF7794 domain-containing protein n=1 Tax=Lactuca sativa TaxID=4236 RepID=A0A9R1V5I2_LACSA|nr:uncharacterized protein LOC111912052 [Lactuca sativa]KAJ0199723.1 hypothetical protein LSAT_V11C600321400 [Lactuca sativa]
MDSLYHRGFFLILLILSSIFCLQSRADGTGSVFFLDSSVHRYLRSPSSEPESMLLPDVGAATSILLGVSPPSTLSSASSEKLNEVLMPNPFERPHAVFMLEIDGVEDMQLGFGPDGDVFSKAFKSKVSVDENDVNIQFSDEEEVSLVSLNEPLPSSSEWTNKDLMDFAGWLGGSYVSTELDPMNGELIVPLSNNAQLKLDMSKQADREFTISLITLIYNVQRTVQMHEDLSGNILSPAELIKGRFDGIKVLKVQYGNDDIVQQGVELLVASLSKIYDTLQAAYKGEIVGVVLLNDGSSDETILNVSFGSPSSRRLEETKGKLDPIIIAQVFLVRRTLAWITGIILIIATLLGVHFLMNMPLTRDTLLYSNVKLD